MAKFQSPLLGYNNNVRHRGRVFHIQTEDSGVNHPHIITHLFMDGGRILKSVKKSYAEHVGTDGMSETVRGLMKEQHKAMFIALRDGQFDELVEGKKKGSGAVVAPVVPAEAQPKPDGKPKEAHEPGPMSAVTAVEEPKKDLAAVASANLTIAASEGEARTRAPATRNDPPPPHFDEIPPKTISEGRRPAAPAGAQAKAANAPRAATDLAATSRASTPSDHEHPKTTPEPERHTSVAELTLDFDALERDSHSTRVSPQFQAGDLPPPPKNLFAKEPRTGTYSTLEADAVHDSTHPPAALGRTPPQPQARPAAASPRSPAQKPATEGRYAPARPAAIFGATNKQPRTSSSIFSDDLVSDKSLDEVILSYLAEDLDPPRRK